MPVALAVPDLALVLAGLLLLLAAFALFVLRDLLVAALSRLPVVGGTVSAYLSGWLNDARDKVLAASWASLAGARRLFDAVASWAVTMWDDAAAGLRQAALSAEWLALTAIPGAYHRALAWSQARISALRRDAAGWYHAALRAAAADAARAESLLGAELAAARRDLDARLSAAEAQAAALADGIRRQADAAVAAARADAAAMFMTAEADIAAARAASGAALMAGISRAEADAAAGTAAARAALTSALSGAVAGIITDLEQTGNDAVEQAWPGAAGDIEALRRSLAGGYGDIKALLDALGGLGAAGLLGALLRAVAGSAVAVRALNDCVIPNCDNLGEFGRDLSALRSDLAGAALLAWITAAVADPVTAADDTVTVLDPFTAAVLGPLASLLSAGATRL